MICNLKTPTLPMCSICNLGVHLILQVKLGNQWEQFCKECIEMMLKEFVNVE